MVQDNLAVRNNKQMFRKALWCLYLLLSGLRVEKTQKVLLPWGAFSLTVPDNVAVARSDKWMSQRQSGSYNEEFLKC